MTIVIDLLILLVCSIVFYILLKDNKIEHELKKEQLKYYQRFNKLYEEDEEVEDIEEDEED